MTSEKSVAADSPRKIELLEAAYDYALTHGLAEMSLRPLASAIGSSPRVLVFLFGSKEGLIRALLARARADELDMLADSAHSVAAPDDLASTFERLWEWLAAEHHRPLLRLWTEAYTRSIISPTGPWSGFARETVDDWLQVLAQRSDPRDMQAPAQCALSLAVLRGALLHLLATDDLVTTSAAVALHGQHLRRRAEEDR